MAGGAFGAETKIRAIEVFYFDLGSHAGGNLVRRVATLAVEATMFALQSESGLLRMIKILLVEINQRNVPATVISVAVGASNGAGRWLVYTGMEARAG